jgi:hypothetical protein
MQFDLRIVAQKIRTAGTEELLDRVTVYRDGMEPAAVDLMENELARRGVSPDQIHRHGERRRRSAVFLPDGTAQHCSFCNRPAVSSGWGLHRLWGLVPVFPRRFWYCTVHLASGRPSGEKSG